MPIADVLDRLTRVDFPIAIDGNIRDAHVDAQHACYVDRLGRLNLTDGEQIPFAVDQGQIAFAVLRLKQLPLSACAGVGCNFSCIVSLII